MTKQIPGPPPEWAPQDHIMIGWPSHIGPWGSESVLQAARLEIAGYANAVLDAGKEFQGGVTRVILVADGAASEAAALDAVPGVEVINIPCGDTWLRDTGPILSWRNGRLQARCFGFNGWGGKYLYPGDEDLSGRLALHLRAERHDMGFVLEGGSVDWDGDGLILTTDECLLNPNRNVGWTRDDAENALKTAFNVTDVIWIRDGLVNDHTDGHIDNLARFVGPGHVVCQTPNGEDDPHAVRLRGVQEALLSFRSSKGGSLKISTIPSPGRVLDEDGDIMPASHMNFVITNQAVIVPVYNDQASAAVEALKPLFPGRKVIARPAKSVLSEGGAFHCISQQIPARPQGEQESSE